MSTKLTHLQFEQRIDALYRFVRQQGYTVTALGSKSPERHYLIRHDEMFVEVTLTSTGRISVSIEQGMSSQGRISPQILAWLESEGLRYEYAQPFSVYADDYLSGDPACPVILHAPKVGGQGTQGRGTDGGASHIWQLLPAQPGWFAIHAMPPDHPVGFEMLPLIGWALCEVENPTTSSEDDLNVTALFVWSTVDRASAPDARPHFVIAKQTGFLGFAFPGCTIDWKQRAEEHNQHYWDEEQEHWTA
jgi:hypothetical protein